MQFDADRFTRDQAKRWLRANLPKLTWEQKRLHVIVAICVHKLAKPTAIGRRRYRKLIAATFEQGGFLDALERELREHGQNTPRNSTG